MAAPRAKLACSSCTRRKVRCSKEIPCSNCIRRGEQDSCSTTPGLAVTSPGASRDTVHVPAISPASTTDTELEYLRFKVAELEAELKHRHSASPVGRDDGPGGVDTTDQRNRLQISGHGVESSRNVRTGSAAKPFSAASTALVKPAPGYPPSSASTSSSADGPDPDAKHAASILEFLSWGRKKNPDYHDVSLEASEAIQNPSNVRDLRDVDISPAFPEMQQDWSKTQLSMIQSLLPHPTQVWELESYHAEYLLWYHGSYHAPTFRRQLKGFYERFNGDITSPGVNLQWVAMLFSVLVGSMTAIPDDFALQLGFRDQERGILSQQWYRAIIKLLNLAEYTANQSILSAQAIATATISAHILGFSNMQSIHLAAANKIAQALGLHKLGEKCPGSPVDVEAGRRVWCQLTTQDWFSIPFSESYLISPLYSKSINPLNCHDDELLSLPEDVPTVMTYCRFLQGIAAIMPHLQDDLMHASTEYTKYMEVRKWDAKIRKMMFDETPKMLSASEPLDPMWPKWSVWARRALAISGNHKIIMVHRSFLSESFTNTAFAYTRKTCLASSKTILSEYKLAVLEDQGPTLWIHQAFAVAASIILLLDMLHRNFNEPEVAEHKCLVEDTLDILQQCKNSMIATRAQKLLSALLMEVERGVAEIKKRKHGDDWTRQSRGLNISNFVKRFCQAPAAAEANGAVSAAGPPVSQPLAVMPADAAFESDPSGVMFGTEMAGQAQPVFNYPNMDGSFENLVWLANQDFTNIM